MNLRTLTDFDFSGDFFLAAAGLGPPSTLGDGSRNFLSLAQSQKKAFKGLTSIGKGSRVLMPVKNTYAGLSDYVSGATRTVGSITNGLNTLTDTGNPFVVGDDGKAIQLVGAGPGGLDLIGFFKYVAAGSGTIWADAGFTIALNASATFAGNLTYVYGVKIQGSGSIFSLIANTLFYNGAGQITLTGADITGAVASSTLKILLQRNGSYTDPLSGPYTAGLAQTSAPLISVKATPGIGFSGLLNSPALSLQIAALRSTTGARSIRSPTSAVFKAVNQTVTVTVPTMQAGGDYWVFFAPFKGFGGVGVHYRLPVMNALQIPESYFTRTVTDAVTNSTTTLTSATAAFTSKDIGKQIVLSGGGSLTTTIESVTNATTIIMTAPASWSSSGNTAQINAMVATTNPRSVSDGVTNNTTTFVSATAAFTTADVGKQIVLSGGTVATNLTTTIASFTNATTVVLSANPGTTATGVTAKIVDVNGALRSIELEWQDGDLTTEAAWIDDYPPPAGTHCFGLNSIVGVGGCYSDASAGPTTTNPGTCIALSLQNFPESFKPTDLLYLPEQIVSVLGRPTDSYVYVGCRDSVHQIQYLGGSPAAVLTTLWPDVGIANPHAWCQVYGIIFAFTSRGGIVTIGPLGQPDSTFSAPVREFTKNWDPLTTAVNWHPDTMQVVVSNGTQAVAYCLQSGGWSSPVYHSDFAAGNALSGVQAGNQMRLTLDNKGTHTLYNWNQGNGSTATAMSQWTRAPEPGRNKTIWQVAEEAQLDNTTNKLFVSIHRNFRKQSDSTASISSASNVLNVSTANFFTAADVGSYVLIVGAGAAGAPLLARIGTFVNGTQVQLVDATTVPLSGAAAQNASTTVSNAALIIGKVIYQRTISQSANQVFNAKRPRVREARTYSIGITLTSTTGDAQPLSATVFGTVDQVARGVTA
jgi:hypothetical protein